MGKVGFGESETSQDLLGARLDVSETRGLDLDLKLSKKLSCFLGFGLE